MLSIRDCITLKACRIIAGVKADEIASVTGVNIETVYKWERGGSFPNVPQMNKIIELYAEKGYAVDVNDIKFF